MRPHADPTPPRPSPGPPCRRLPRRGRAAAVVAGVTAALLVPGGAPAPAAPPPHATPAAASEVTALGAAADHGSMAGRDLVRPVVAIAATPTGDGYWLAAADGGVFAYGDARYHGSTGDITLNQPVVAIAATPTGDGYWLAAADGGVFAYGDARYHGSTGDITLNQPVVAIAATPTGDGYWLAAADGGVFAYGDARYHGSTGDITLNQPVVAIAATPTGDGYWLAAADGGVFAFGDARYLGSAPGGARAVAISASPTGAGYLVARADGGLEAYGDAIAPGPGQAPASSAPVVAVAFRPQGDGAWLAHGRTATLPRGGTSILPEFRVVAFYGGATTAVLGVLGEGTPDQAAARLVDQADPYASGDRPLLPAFEVIATVALSFPGPEGTYSNPTSIEDLRRYLDAVRAVEGIMILDIQPGRADLLAEARRYEELLAEPDVSLAIDPEWAVGPGQVPGSGLIGSVDASEVNAVSAYLADLVARHDLPEKLLVLHRFEASMVTDAEAVVARPGVEVVFHVDGFGTPAAKLADYHGLTRDGFGRGIKLFYDEDTGLMSPADVLGLVPAPDLVTYQ